MPWPKGRKRPEEQRRNISEGHKGLKKSAETKIKIAKALTGARNPQFGKRLSGYHRITLLQGLKHPTTGLKISKALKGRTITWADKIRQAHKGKACLWMRGERNPRRYCAKPTKPERELMKLITQNKLPYKYVGDGSFWVGNINPDFININHEKQVIEVFGEYWHDIFDVSRRRESLREYGFACLIIWESELKDNAKVVTKIRKFMKAGSNNG